MSPTPPFPLRSGVAEAVIGGHAVCWMNSDADDDDGVFTKLPGPPNRGRL